MMDIAGRKWTTSIKSVSLTNCFPNLIYMRCANTYVDGQVDIIYFIYLTTNLGVDNK